MNDGWHGFGMGFGGWLVPLLVIGVIIYFMRENGKNRKQPSHSSAQEILDKRYANGGLSKEEYEEKSKHIRAQAEA